MLSKLKVRRAPQGYDTGRVEDPLGNRRREKNILPLTFLKKDRRNQGSMIGN